MDGVNLFKKEATHFIGQAKTSLSLVGGKGTS